MAKKKRVEIKNVPLESVTVGKIKQNKHSLFFTIVIFSLFVCLIYFLPDINKYYPKLLNILGIVENISNDVDGENSDEVKEEDSDDSGENIKDETDTNYSVDKNPSIVLNNLSFTEFKYEENRLVFTVSNNSMENISIKDKGIFLHVFDKKDNLLSWYMLDGNVTAGGSLLLEIPNITKFEMFNIFETTEYVDSGLDANENGEIKLSCENDEEKIVYTFVNKKLVKVNYDLKFDSGSLKYSYSTYMDLFNKYRYTDGIDVNIISSSISVNYIFEVDYTIYNGKLNDFYYFAKDESVDKVNYIMKSLPYKCS